MAQLVKTMAGLAIASVKTVNGLSIASVKTVAGLDNTSGGGNNPTFSEQVAANAGPTGSDATTVLTLSSAVAQNNQVVVIFTWSSAQTLSSITDTGGNTYTVHQTQAATVSGVPVQTMVASARATTALAISDTITLNWGAADFGYRFGRAFEVADVQGSGQPDQSAKATGTSTNPAATAITTATDTCAVGAVINATAGFTSSAWTTIGSSDLIDFTFRATYLFDDIDSAGSQNPAATIGGNETWICLWVALK